MTTFLLVDDALTSAEMRHEIGEPIMDDLIFIEHEGRRIVVGSVLEESTFAHREDVVDEFWNVHALGAEELLKDDSFPDGFLMAELTRPGPAEGRFDDGDRAVGVQVARGRLPARQGDRRPGRPGCVGPPAQDEGPVGARGHRACPAWPPTWRCSPQPGCCATPNRRTAASSGSRARSSPPNGSGRRCRPSCWGRGPRARRSSFTRATLV